MGDVPFVHDSVNASTGVFLSIPWDSTSTSLSIENSPIRSAYVDPDSYRQLYLDGGTVNLSEKEKNGLSGSFNLEATVDQTEIEITGEFKATRRNKILSTLLISNYPSGSK